MLKEGRYYICSPLSAPTEEGIRQNMLMARHYMELVGTQFGCRAMAPHAYLPELLDDRNPEERSLGLEFGMALLELCDGIIVCGRKISNGMTAEIRKAVQAGLLVYFLMEVPGGIYLISWQEGGLSDEMPVL